MDLKSFYKLLPGMKPLLAGIMCLAVFTGCEKDEPVCKNCLDENPIQQDTTSNPLSQDVRAQYTGKFKVRYSIQTRYYSMGQASYIYSDSVYQTTLTISYNPTDSLKNCFFPGIPPNLSCKVMPALIFSYNPAIPANYTSAPTIKPGVYNDMLYDASPFNQGGFVNVDSINYVKDNSRNSRDGEIYTITGTRIK